MKWIAMIMVGVVVAAGCATGGSRVPPHMSVVSVASMHGLHCIRISTSGIHQILFDKDANGGPVTAYRVMSGRNNGVPFYRVRVYSSTRNEKPETGVFYHHFPGKVALTIEMPGFVPGRDMLIMADDKGEYPVAVR